MADELLKSNLHFDEINKIRILDPVADSEINDMKELVKDFEEKLQDFIQFMDSIYSKLKELADDLEYRKLAAIGVTNLSNLTEKDLQSQKASLEATLMEKRLILDQLEAEYDSLLIQDNSHQETIGYLTQMQ